MKVNKKRLVLIFLLINVMAATGFLREFVFVNINEQLRFLWYNNDVSFMSDKLAFLSSWDYENLYYFKWFLTVLFSVIFMIESAVVLKVLFNKHHIQELLFIYTLLLLVSAILYIGFWTFATEEEGYILARYFMGLAQSPVPLMLMIPALFLRRKIRSTQ